jgi:hypothetical protein
VWGTWAVLLAGLLYYVGRFASDVPVVDDWEFVPVLTGSVPLDASWLWARHNEHRLPLPKLLLVGLSATAGYDPRAGMYASCVLMGIAAAALILLARRLRGRTAYADAFFPLALLNWGQSYNLLVAIAVHPVSCTLLAVLALVTLASTPHLSTGKAVLFGVLLICLPLCGGTGLALVPALALWLVWIGMRRWRSDGRRARRDACVILAMAAVALAGVGGYFWDDARLPAPGRSRPSISTVLETAGRFFAMCLGPAGESTWPFSSLALLLLCLSTVGLLAWVWRSQPSERVRAFGLLAYLAALVSLGMAIGWGRASIAPASTRFVTVAAPLLCWVYVCWILYLDRFMPKALFLVMILVVVFDTQQGWIYGTAHRRRMNEVENDIRAGMSSEQLARKWTGAVYDTHGDPVVIAERFEMLRKTRQGPFK